MSFLYRKKMRALRVYFANYINFSFYLLLKEEKDKKKDYIILGPQYWDSLRPKPTKVWDWASTMVSAPFNHSCCGEAPSRVYNRSIRALEGLGFFLFLYITPKLNLSPDKSLFLRHVQDGSSW
jgi:hypothetical protein